MAAKAKRSERLARAIVFADAGTSIEALLEDAGVSAEEYAGLLLDGEFMSKLEKLSAHAAEAECARVLRSLGELSKGGDPKVVRLYFDLLEERRRRCDDSDAYSALHEELWGGA